MKNILSLSKRPNLSFKNQHGDIRIIRPGDSISINVTIDYTTDESSVLAKTKLTFEWDGKTLRQLPLR